jgi:hypothetical protein
MKKLVILLVLGTSMLVTSGVSDARKSILLENVAKSALANSARDGRVPEEVIKPLSQVLAVTTSWLDQMDMSGWSDTQADLAITAYWLGVQAGFKESKHLEKGQGESSLATSVLLVMAIVGVGLVMDKLREWWKARKATPPKLT